LPTSFQTGLCTALSGHQEDHAPACLQGTVLPGDLIYQHYRHSSAQPAVQRGKLLLLLRDLLWRFWKAKSQSYCFCSLLQSLRRKKRCRLNK